MRVRRWGIAAALGLVICAFAVRQLESTDFWWQLHLGRYIQQSHTVPTADLFTLTAKGNHYIDSHWLFQVVLWSLYRLAGVNGIILTTALVALGTWAIALACVPAEDRDGLGAVPALLGIVAASERFVPRPDLVSIAFLAVTVFVIGRYRTRGGHLIWMLPLLGLVWVNMHGLWILGPIVVGAYCVGDAVLHRVKLPSEWRAHAMPPERLRTAWIALGGMVLAAFCTPQPLAQALYPFRLFREISSSADFVASSVTEVASPFAQPHWSVSTWAFVALLCVLALGVVRSRRRLDPPSILLCLAFAYLGWTARRNMPLFAVVAVPVCLELWRPRNPESIEQRTQPAFGIVGILGACLVAWAAATNRVAVYDGTLSRFGLGLHRTLEPTRLAAQIPDGFAGRIWNTPAFGGYLEWRLWPEQEPVIDGRWEMYTPEFLRLYGRSLHDFAVWEDFAKRHDINAAVIAHRRPDYIDLLRYLYRAPGWRLAYVDAFGALFVRNTEEMRRAFPAEVPLVNSGVHEFNGTERLGFQSVQRLLDDIPPRPQDASEAELLGNFFFVLQTPEADIEAQKWFTRALEVSPRSYVAHVSLGTLAAERGDYSTAQIHFRAATRARSWQADAWIGLADAGMRLGDTEGAAHALDRAKRLAPSDPRLKALESQLRTGG